MFHSFVTKPKNDPHPWNMWVLLALFFIKKVPSICKHIVGLMKRVVELWGIYYNNLWTCLKCTKTYFVYCEVSNMAMAQEFVVMFAKSQDNISLH